MTHKFSGQLLILLELQHFLYYSFFFLSVVYSNLKHNNYCCDFEKYFIYRVCIHKNI